MVVAGVALAVLTSWPLVLHMPSRIAPDLGDPVRTAWQVACVGHAMLHDPLHLFDANVFYPHPLSLAFSDSLLGYGPAAFFGTGTVAALVRYNLLFLFAWSLCFVGAYLLARELGPAQARRGGRRRGVRVRALPRDRGRPPARDLLRRHRARAVPAAARLPARLARAGRRRLAGVRWQISLGFTLGLQFSYLLAVLTRDRRRRTGCCAGPPGAAAQAGRDHRAWAFSSSAPSAIYQARPYLKISHDYPTAKRTLKEVKTYSAGPAAWLSASSENRVWGGLTAGARAHVHSKNEQVLFPGGFILLLALVGLAAPFYTRRLRIGLAVGVVVCAVFAVGLGLTGYGYPYRLLYNFAPGWDGVRVPGRVFTTATLFLALLAGAGAQLLAGRLGAFASRHTGAGGRGARCRRSPRSSAW